MRNKETQNSKNSNKNKFQKTPKNNPSKNQSMMYQPAIIKNLIINHINKRNKINYSLPKKRKNKMLRNHMKALTKSLNIN